MTDAGLFIAIAEIAGVFVGFGALISVTRRRDIEPEALGAIRAVVTTGLTVVIAALIPVALDAYGLGERTTWFVASLAFLVLSWAIIALSLRAPATREFLDRRVRTQPGPSLFYWVALESPIQVPLILAVLGVFPDLDRAFYLTALAFNLFQAAFVLAQFVYAQGGDETSVDEGG